MTTLTQNIKKQRFNANSIVRCTRGMTAKTKVFDTAKLVSDIHYSKDTISKNLDLDLDITKKLDYKHRILFNPKYSPVPKINLRYTSIIFQFLMNRVFPGYLE